jgi:hypothetical protein
MNYKTLLKSIVSIISVLLVIPFWLIGMAALFTFVDPRICLGVVGLIVLGVFLAGIRLYKALERRDDGLSNDLGASKTK